MIGQAITMKTNSFFFESVFKLLLMTSISSFHNNLQLPAKLCLLNPTEKQGTKKWYDQTNVQSLSSRDTDLSTCERFSGLGGFFENKDGLLSKKASKWTRGVLI